MRTDSLSELRASWPRWAEYLRNHRLGNMAAWMLEAAGPLTVLGAQLLYLGEPFLRPALSNRQLYSLAALLESRDEAHAFAVFLREELTP